MRIARRAKAEARDGRFTLHHNTFRPPKVESSLNDVKQVYLAGQGVTIT